MGLARVGYVLIASGALALVGALLQLTGVVPAHYTWTAPFEILRDVIARPNFPTALIAAWGLGVARRARWRFPASAGARQFRWRSELTLPALVGLATIALDVAAFPLHHAADRILLALGAAMLSYHLRQPDAFRHALGSLAWTVAAFTLVSFGYTAVKAALFVARDTMDPSFLRFETALFGEPLHVQVVRAFQHVRGAASFFDEVYFSFFDHMLLTSALLMGLRQDAKRNEFVAALVFCYVLGGPAYYLLPAFGPAYATPELYEFLAEQAPRAAVIERMLLQNTGGVIDGVSTSLATFGYVASMPSLHVAHELVMVWFARDSRPALILSSLFAAATVLSTLFLGWHYFVDALGGAAVAGAALWLAHRFRARAAPSFLQRPDSPLT